MTLTEIQKDKIKNKIREKFSKEREVQKVVVFGSFIKSEHPNDIDIAIFQNSDESYLSLALKYRKLIREISRILPTDVIPLKSNTEGDFIDEIQTGQLIYEK